VLPDPFREMRAWSPRRPNSLATPQGLEQRSKMEEVVLKMARRRGWGAGKLRRLSRILDCTNVSPLQRGGAVPAPLFERWAEMARQLPRGARPFGRPQSSENLKRSFCSFPVMQRYSAEVHTNIKNYVEACNEFAVSISAAYRH